MGYFRDDTPLMELILDEKGQKEAEPPLGRIRLHRRLHGAHLDSVLLQPERRSARQGRRVRHARARRIKQITDAAVIFGLRDAYLAKAAADPRTIRWRTRRSAIISSASTPRCAAWKGCARRPSRSIWKRLLQFAARAYRRPLTQAERDDLLAYYHTLREKNEPVARRGDPRFDRQRADVARISAIGSTCSTRSADCRSRTGPVRSNDVACACCAGQPLSGYALASRLSYFLWSSMPDEELLAHAAAGDLQKPDVLLAQTRRMLKDDGRADWRPSSPATGSISAASKPTTRWTASAFPASTTTCARPCSRSRSGLSRT